MSPEVEITVIGAGSIGREIVYALATSGASTVLHDNNPGQLDHATTWVRRQPTAQPVRIRPAARLDEALATCDLVIESVPEDAELKQGVFAELGRLTDEKVILTSNSSTMPASRWAATTPHPERLVNLHFYTRPWERRVAELMAAPNVDAAVLARTTEILTTLDFRVFKLAKESIGLLYNRIWAAVKRESLRIVDEGIADPAEIDEICRLLDPCPNLGPFQRMDRVGLDTVQAIERVYLDGPTDRVSTTLAALIERGDLGVKTGRGFYSYHEWRE